MGTAGRWAGFEVLDRFGVNAIAQTQQPLPGTGTGRHPALDRSGGEHCQQRVLLGEGIGLRRARVVSDATLPQKLGELVRHANDHASHFFVVGWRERVKADRSDAQDGIDAV
jgi:hypothetical protein